jgi:hypothetical protein
LEIPNHSQTRKDKHAGNGTMERVHRLNLCQTSGIDTLMLCYLCMLGKENALCC